MKYYYNIKYSDLFHDKHYWQDFLNDYDMDEIELFEGKREFGAGHMWCPE